MDEDAAAAAQLLKDLTGSYQELWPVILADEHTQTWLDDCTALVGEDNAQGAYEKLSSMVTGEVYGEDAVKAYANGGGAYFCGFTNDLVTLTVDGESSTISGTDKDGKELFRHTYHYIGMEPVRGLYEFESDDADSGEFTYFYFAPDTSAGISKGAFYRFYPSKEHLFYALLRQMHAELYGPAMQLLQEGRGTPARQLTQAILAGCRALDESGLCRFWEQDAPEILCAIPPEERRAQQEQEYAVFHRFLTQSGTLRVPEEQAVNALRSLILTVPMRKKLGEDYPHILFWMAQGICAQLF